VEAHAGSSTGTHYLVIGSGLAGKPDVTIMSSGSVTASSVEAAVLQITGS
jgi:hypothetical protein